MSLPKFTPDELAEDLDTMASEVFVLTFPEIPKDETIAGEAAAYIRSATELLTDIAEDGGKFADRARAVITRRG
jgi:hypothetical protein